MRKFVLLSLFLCGSLCAFSSVGDTFTIDTLSYTVLPNGGEVSVAAANKTIREVAIPESVEYNGTMYKVTRIADNGFNGCANIFSVSIPGSVERIGVAAFRDLKQSFTLTLKEGIKEIGNRAFCKSTGLTGELIFPSTLDSIGDQAFGGCNNVSYIEFLSEKPVLTTRSNFCIDAISTKRYIVDIMFVPDGQGETWRKEYKATSWYPAYPFANKTTETIDGDYVYDIYDVNDVATETGARVSAVLTLQCPEHVTFPETVTINEQKRNVTDVKASCFNKGNSFLSTIKTIEFPSTMRRIGKEAFRSITTQFTVEFNEGLEEIGDRAFCRSTGLLGTTSRIAKGESALIIPASVSTIRSYAFCECTGIKDSIVLLSETPPIVPKDDGYLFAETNAIVRIPCGAIGAYKADTVNYWSTRTVYDPCDENIVLGPHFIYRVIDKEKRYVSLLGRRIVSISNPEIPDYFIPEGKTETYCVKKIAANAFNKSTLLTSISIPNTVDTIESNAFINNASLKQVTVAAKVIGASAFNECTALEEVVLKEGVTTIKDRAFIRCYGLEEVTFPSTIEYIEDYAFYLDTLITDITFEGEVPPILGGINILGEKTSLKNIWVPCGSYETYYTTNRAERWPTLRDYIRSSCPELVLSADETINENQNVSSISLRRQFNMNEWTPLYFPSNFELDSVLVEEMYEGKPYYFDINYPWVEDRGGYFYLETMENINTTEQTVSFKVESEIQSGKPYLIMFLGDENGDGYFRDKNIIFKSKRKEYVLRVSPKNDFAGGASYTLKGNEGYVNETVPVGYFLTYNQGSNTYHLNKTTNGNLAPFSFVLLPDQEIVSNPAFAPRMFAMRTYSMGNISGGNVSTSIATNSNTESIRYTREGEQVTIYPAGKDVKVYSIDGMLLYSVEAGMESMTMDLGAGMYILWCNGNSQKMLL